MLAAAADVPAADAAAFDVAAVILGPDDVSVGLTGTWLVPAGPAWPSAVAGAGGPGT